MHTVLSGNKWLKLKGWLNHYQQGQYKGICSIGGPWSNHLHALAYACHLLGVPFTAYIKGNNKQNSATLADLKNWGAELLFFNAGFQEMVENIAASSLQKNQLFIPMGGDGEPGYQSVSSYFATVLFDDYSDVWIAAGSGTTACGLAAVLPSNVLLHIVLPGLEPPKAILAINEKHPNLSIEKLDGRFGKISDDLTRWLLMQSKENNLQLDAIYTGRVFRAAATSIHQTAQAQDGRKHLLIHTGGLQGNRSIETLAHFYQV